MSAFSPHKILADDEGPVAEVIHPGGAAPVVLVCEHASAEIPRSLGDLGLAPGDRYSHAVWDIGALALARRLSAALDAPLVAARWSRLVYDANRPPGEPSAIPARTERIAVPGNAALTDAERAERAATFHDPLHAEVEKVFAGRASDAALVTIHSFTPVWNGEARAVELGLLHDADDRLARAALAAAPAALRTELNAPYGPQDGVTHTLRLHGLARGRANLMIELRNDLISDNAGVARIAAALTPMLRTALEQVEPAA